MSRDRLFLVSSANDKKCAWCVYVFAPESCAAALASTELLNLPRGLALQRNTVNLTVRGLWHRADREEVPGDRVARKGLAADAPQRH